MWDELVVNFLTNRVEFEVASRGIEYSVEGAKEARVAVSRHVNSALRARGAEKSVRTGAVRLRVHNGAIEARGS